MPNLTGALHPTMDSRFCGNDDAEFTFRHPRASGDPWLVVFTCNIAEGAARLFFGYPFRPLQFAPLGLLEAAFIGYPRALEGRQRKVDNSG